MSSTGSGVNVLVQAAYLPSAGGTRRSLLKQELFSSSVLAESGKKPPRRLKGLFGPLDEVAYKCKALIGCISVLIGKLSKSDSLVYTAVLIATQGQAML